MGLRVTVWHENRHEKKHPEVARIYPDGMHRVLADALSKAPDLDVSTATLDEPEAGLTEEKLRNTDVLTWWGHMAHSDVQDLVVERVYNRVVRQGMGLVVLHSGHFSKIFRKLMGTTCDLKWRDTPHRETLWVTRPGHPIVQHIDDHFVIEQEEMYGEYFDIPEPETTFLISSFSPGNEVCRSGCTWTRGAGKVVYFRPGHELFPTYYNPTVTKVIENAVRWAAPAVAQPPVFGKRELGWDQAATS